jgi:hypothetical protein
MRLVPWFTARTGMIANGLRADSGDLAHRELPLRNHGLFREANSG